MTGMHPQGPRAYTGDWKMCIGVIEDYRIYQLKKYITSSSRSFYVTVPVEYFTIMVRWHYNEWTARDSQDLLNKMHLCEQDAYKLQGHSRKLVLYVMIKR